MLTYTKRKSAMKISQLVGALPPVNHRGLHHGYSNEKMDEKINGFFLSNTTVRRLSEEQMLSCEGILKEAEVLEALKQMEKKEEEKKMVQRQVLMALL